MSAAGLLSFNLPVPAVAPVKTFQVGLAGLDALSGGIPVASLTEVCGKASSGRAALLLSLLQNTSRQGELCVLVDVQDSFDPDSAVRVGVQLTRLLWVRCSGNVEHALKAADLLIRAGAFGLVILDLSGVPDFLTRRIPLTSWFRLRHAAEQTGAALVVIGEQFYAGSSAKLQLELRQQEKLWSHRLLHGITVVAGLHKRNRLRSTSFRIVR